jgi:hypothetical protein
MGINNLMASRITPPVWKKTSIKYQEQSGQNRHDPKVGAITNVAVAKLPALHLLGFISA